MSLANHRGKTLILTDIPKPAAQLSALPAVPISGAHLNCRGGASAQRPNFLRIVQERKNNVRDAVNSLQVELLAV